MILKIIKHKYVNKPSDPNGPDGKRSQVSHSIRYIECNSVETETSNIGTVEKPITVTNYNLDQDTSSHRNIAVHHETPEEDAPQPSVYLMDNSGDTISRLM